jgi:hypothetical protein
MGNTLEVVNYYYVLEYDERNQKQSPGARNAITRRKESSPGARNAITRRKESSPGAKSHHPAQRVITRLVRVIQKHNLKSKGLSIGVIHGLPEQVGQ